MNVLSLISAVLISVMTPVSLPDVPGVKMGRAVLLDDYAIVAVIPDPISGMESKNETLRSAAEILGKEFGKEVYLTDDLITFITLSRIEKRGADDYERHNLASRLAKVKSYSCRSEMLVK